MNKNAKKFLILFYNLHIFASDQANEEGNKKFLFFGATFEQLSSQKATFERKARWDSERPEKSRPDPLSSYLRLSFVKQLLAVKDWDQNCTKRGLFNIEDNYKCNANKARNTSLLYLLDVY